MCRRLAVVGVVLALVLGSVSVVWAGLNWPPPLWILEYGGPHSQRPTGKTITVEGVTFVMISPGYFRMGSDWLAVHPEWLASFVPGSSLGSRGDVAGRVCGEVGVSWGKAPKPSSEMPVHWCRFPHGFGIAETEVTNAEYERFDPKHQRFDWSKGDRDPVVLVSWEDEQNYCAWLSKKSGRKVVLPSESEWECACRAGSETEYAFGNDASRLGEYAWYLKNCGRRGHEVATKKPNAWGLFDMEGNVAEDCEDRWHDRYLLTRKVKERDGTELTETVGLAPDDGTAWERGGSPDRVCRGGSWGDLFAASFRYAARWEVSPSGGSGVVGFRPVLECGPDGSPGRSRGSPHGPSSLPAAATRTGTAPSAGR